MQLSIVRSTARSLRIRSLRAILCAALPVALLLTLSAGSPHAAPAQHGTHLYSIGWIEVLRTTPIVYLDELEADRELDAVSVHVASFVRAAGSQSYVEPNQLRKDLEESFPRAQVTMTSDAMEYFYYVDQDGKLVRVCVSVTEIGMSFTKSGADIVVLLRKQMEV